MGAEDDFRARNIGRDHLKRVAAAEFRGARATRFGARRTVRSARTRIEKKRRKKIQCEKGDDVVPRGLGPRVAAATRNEGGAAAHPVPTVSFLKDTRGRKTSVKSTFRHSWDEVLPPPSLPRDGGPQRREWPKLHEGGKSIRFDEWDEVLPPECSFGTRRALSCFECRMVDAAPR